MKLNKSFNLRELSKYLLTPINNITLLSGFLFMSFPGLNERPLYLPVSEKEEQTQRVYTPEIGFNPIRYTLNSTEASPALLPLAPLDYYIMNKTLGQEVAQSFGNSYYLSVSDSFLEVSNPLLLNEVLNNILYRLTPVYLELNGKKYETRGAELFQPESIPGLTGYKLNIVSEGRTLELTFIPHLKAGKEAGLGLLAYVKSQGNDATSQRLAQEFKTNLLITQAQGQDTFLTKLKEVSQEVQQEFSQSLSETNIPTTLNNLLLEFYFPGLKESDLNPAQLNFLSTKKSSLLAMLEKKEVKLNELFTRSDFMADLSMDGDGELPIFDTIPARGGYKDFSRMALFRFSLSLKLQGKIEQMTKANGVKETPAEAEKRVTDSLDKEFASLKNLVIEFIEFKSGKGAEAKRAKINIGIPAPKLTKKDNNIELESSFSKEFKKEDMQVESGFDWKNVKFLTINIIREGGTSPITVTLDANKDDKTRFLEQTVDPTDLINEYKTALSLLPLVLNHFTDPQRLLGPDPQAHTNREFYDYLFKYVAMTNLGLNKGENSFPEVLRLVNWRKENIWFLAGKYGFSFIPYKENPDMKRILTFEEYLNRQQIIINGQTFKGNYIDSLYLPDYPRYMRQMRENSWKESQK